MMNKDAYIREEEYVSGLRDGFNREFNHYGTILEEKVYKNEKMISSQRFSNLLIEGNQVARPNLHDLMKIQATRSLLEAGQKQKIQEKRPHRDVLNGLEKMMDKGDASIEYWGS